MGEKTVPIIFKGLHKNPLNILWDFERQSQKKNERKKKKASPEMINQ